MNNTFEMAKKKEKTLKQLFDRTLHKNNGLSLCFFVCLFVCLFFINIYIYIYIYIYTLVWSYNLDDTKQHCRNKRSMITPKT